MVSIFPAFETYRKSMLTRDTIWWIIFKGIIKKSIHIPAPKAVDIPMSIMKPIIGDRFDFTIHGENEDDSKVVASHVTKEQLEEFKKRADALKASWR